MVCNIEEESSNPAEFFLGGYTTNNQSTLSAWPTIQEDGSECQIQKWHFLWMLGGLMSC